MKRSFRPAVVVLLAFGAAGCTATAAPTTRAASPPPGSTVGASTPPAATGSRAPAARVSWRGSAFALPAGWRQVFRNQDELCLRAVDSPTDACGGDVAGDWIYLYASERSGGAEGEPGHASSLDATGMDSFTYDGGTTPVDMTDTPKIRDGTRPVGGRTAFYGEWRLICSDQPEVLVQRWVLPKSRLGVQSYARSEAVATQIEQMVAGVDLSGYNPTKPNPQTR